MELNQRVFGCFENKLIQLITTNFTKYRFMLGNAYLFNRTADKQML